MKNQNTGSLGFTLIELLVVVLIIGILAAVALPQYQKAVEKSRVAGVWSILSSFQKAAEAYRLEEPDWWDLYYPKDLDVDFGFSYEGAFCSGSTCQLPCGSTGWTNCSMFARKETQDSGVSVAFTFFKDAQCNQLILNDRGEKKCFGPTCSLLGISQGNQLYSC